MTNEQEVKLEKKIKFYDELFALQNKRIAKLELMFDWAIALVVSTIVFTSTYYFIN